MSNPCHLSFRRIHNAHKSQVIGIEFALSYGNFSLSKWSALTYICGDNIALHSQKWD